MTADDQFGHCRKPEVPKDWELGNTPASLCVLDRATGKSFSDFLAATGSKPFTRLAETLIFLWCIAPDTKVFVAAEEVANINARPVQPGYPVRRGLGFSLTNERKLGHPCLVDNEARAAGELYIDDSEGERVWMLNFKSGRFHGGTNSPPTDDQIKNIAQHFANLLDSPVELDLDDDFPIV